MNSEFEGQKDAIAIAKESQRFAKKMFTHVDISEIENGLKSVPPPVRALRPAAALSVLSPALQAAKARGHDLESLVQICMSHGLKTSARNIARALQAHSSKNGPRRTAASTQEIAAK
nr:hypothetical protein [uncultured Rhodoferax sp.]